MRANKKIIILDADDVLYPTNRESLIRQEKLSGVKLPYDRISKWGLLGEETPHYELYNARLSSFSDPEQVRALPIYPGAKEFVEELVKKYEVVICTSVPANVANARFESLRENFPMILPDNIIFGSRKRLLSAFASLDDNASNYRPGGNVKFPVIFTQPWNLNTSARLRVNNYKGFLKLLKVLEDAEHEKEYKGICIVGPSGADKNDIVRKFEQFGFERVKSCSTRVSPNYIHVDRESFYGPKTSYVQISSYMGELYGIRKSELGGKKHPIVLLDISGAISMSSEGYLMVFVDADKETCIRNILRKDISEDEMVNRLSSLEDEFLNKKLCDEVITSSERDEDIRRIAEMII